MIVGIQTLYCHTHVGLLDTICFSLFSFEMFYMFIIVHLC